MNKWISSIKPSRQALTARSAPETARSWSTLALILVTVLSSKVRSIRVRLVETFASVVEKTILSAAASRDLGRLGLVVIRAEVA